MSVTGPDAATTTQMDQLKEVMDQQTANQFFVNKEKAKGDTKLDTAKKQVG
jgi:hypothetical protein